MSEKRQSALSKPVKVSKELSEIVKSDFLPRTEIVKKMWVYIKSNGCQNPEKKSIIIPDAILSRVLGSDPINMFKMNTKINAHILS